MRKRYLFNREGERYPKRFSEKEFGKRTRKIFKKNLLKPLKFFQMLPIYY